MPINMNNELQINSSVNLFKKPNKLLIDLSQNKQSPCISIYLSTHRHHPDNLKDPIRFASQIKEIELSLRSVCTSSEIQSLVAPLLNLKKDMIFWNHTLDGLAVFSSPTLFKVCKLQRTVPDLAIVSESFHIKPLMRIFQTTDRYQVLSINSREVKLFEGNRDVLDEIELSFEVPSTKENALGELARSDENSERFYRIIDQAILDHHSRGSGLPLFLASLPENQAAFRAVSHNPFLMPEGLDLHADSLSNIELRDRIWKLAKPFYDARLGELIEVFNEAESKDLGSDDLDQIARAAVNGKVSTLLIESERIIPGHIDHKTGAILHDELEDPRVDDLLDDLGECVLSKGGNIVITPPHLMPTDKGMAAIYRY